MKKVLGNNVFISLITGLLLALLTFPHYEITFQAGIDPPLKWVFTHFATNGFDDAQHLTFPHGPLAFLMYPLKETLWLTAISTILLKVFLIFSLVKLYSKMCFLRWVHVLLSAYLIFVLASFNQLLIASVLTSYLVFYKTDNATFKMSGFFLTAIALYVKSYVAILTGMITILFILYYLWKKRNYLLTLIDVSILGALFLSIWLFLFSSFSGFLDFFYGMMQLAQDNSSAAAHYPVNNWWVLIPFILIIALLPFLQKSKRAVFFGVLVLPSLFGAWKHGMAREDIFHVNGLFAYVAVVYLLFLLFERSNRLLNTIAIGLGLYLFSINMPNSVNYVPTSYNWYGFNDVAILFETPSQPTLDANKLPHEIREIIGHGSVDVYPWDYSIVAVNDLNWKPRPVIHSYAAYTPWLDRRDAEHFSSDNKPKFIIWELDKIGGDINNSCMHSIDGRYLLNNEPQTILQLLSSYSAIYRDKKFLVLKANAEINYTSKTISGQKTIMNQWIEVPIINSGLLRAKVIFSGGILQRLKSFTYKDDQFWIQLHLQSGEIHRYRIVPKNVKNGIWITPYIHDLDMATTRVDSIKIINSNPSIINNEISVDWEHITFNNPKHLEDFFHLKKSKKINEVLFASNHFDGDAKNFSYDFEKIKRSNHNSFYETDEEFCAPFEIELNDSIPNGLYNVWVQVDVKTDFELQDLQLIVSSGAGANAYWQSTFLKHQLIDTKNWNSVVSSNEVNLNKKNKTLKVYLFNPKKQLISLDNIEIFIRKID